ncbi:pH-response regulator protein palH/rim-21 [Amniculicola lignicola CBS 123094]|uniref:pH-response regulator protein palH/rim-21 n=1 Tax=Amniculicola lignicola CBS 123094 TaxID=1392246 RepID=A0A6A5WDC0_9PLEO|nr:pH-response regulator protein palH/rim-21 [Amniculicola lignicola CBS 123094]
MEGPEGWKRAQLLGDSPTTTSSYRAQCTPFKLPADGIIQINPDFTVTLTAGATFTPACIASTTNVPGGGDGSATSVNMHDPFHASITPQAYATGAATVIAWMLVIMLIITPRTFFVGGASPRSGLMGRRGMIGGASGGGSIIGVGTRPWLQKVAALTVAVSLTLATADTFKIAEQQYEDGFMDAMKLRNQVVSGMEIKVSRVISDVFLWLAQVQTLIRLFPRHKEKVIIKWVGFALVLLDIIFSSLNSFGPYNTNRGRERKFDTAVPALSYLFQLSLSMLYAAWVLYYSITKRRYAYYHSMMWNITIVALLSIIAILTPVVFFITDISNYTIAGWGDYFRWVGAAAASVIVWEWVERIEALEREERKDGILGREVYDGDEMLDTTPSNEMSWPRGLRNSDYSDMEKRPSNDGKGGGGAYTSGHAHGFTQLAHRFGRSRGQQEKTEPHKRRSLHVSVPAPTHRRSESQRQETRPSRNYLPLQSPPAEVPQIPTVGSPVSRTDTTSADSTVYTIRYHPISNTPPIPRQPVIQEGLPAAHNLESNADLEKAVIVTQDLEPVQSRSRWNWQAVPNPFRRRGRSPPPEVQRGRVIEPLAIDDVTAAVPPRNYTGLALKDRLGTLAAQQGERFRSKKNAGQQSETHLPVTIIPAQPRGRTWSPEIMHQDQDDEVDVVVPAITAATGLHFQNGAAASSVLGRENPIEPPGTRQPAETQRLPNQSPPNVALGTELRGDALDQTLPPHAIGERPPTPQTQTNPDR